MNAKAMKHAVAASSLICLIGGAFAGIGDLKLADPKIDSEDFKINGVVALESSFREYSEKAAVGRGKVNQPFLFFIDEKTEEDPFTHKTVKSWYIFFDPACQGTVEADITFSSAILGVHSTSAALRKTDSVFGIDVDGDGKYNDYRSRRSTGTERRDQTTWDTEKDPYTLHISWKAGGTGDHIRVMTALHVPEPQTYALMLAGLGIMGAVARRRARRETA